ncbi:type I restriction enzyme endonuclease domain-containing protein [Methanomethylovorans sp.]
MIEELIDLAEALGLTEDEIAFYDALKTNDSAVKVIPCGL